MKKYNLAFIDLETTGLDPEKHEIIEIGALVVKQPELKIIDELDVKVKPLHIETADPAALRINGYRESEWLFAADLSQALKLLAEKTQNAVMVAQNVTFDWSFLNKAFRATGIVNKMHYHKLDLISMAYAKLYKDERLERYNLRELAGFFNIENKKAHSAMSDIKTAFEIYKKLIILP